MNRNRRQTQSVSFGKILFFLIFLIIIAGAAFIYFKFNKILNGSLTPVSTKNVNLTNQYSVPGHLYFVKDKNLWDANDTKVSQVTKTGNVQMPTLSPTGQSLVYVYYSLNYSDLIKSSINGSNTTQLTHNQSSRQLYDNYWASSPAYSPDGSYILFSSDKGKVPGVTSYDLAIWLYNVSTKHFEKLTTPHAYTGGDADPSWDPQDSNYFVYTKYIYLLNDSIIHSQIMLYDMSTGQEYPITPPDQNNLQAQISPDGKYLVYINTPSNYSTQSDEIYLMPFNISNIETSTTLNSGEDATDYKQAILLETGQNAQPTFAPSGINNLPTNDYMIAYVALQDNSFNLNILNIAQNLKTGTITKGKQYQITNNSAIDSTSHLIWRN